MDVIKKLLTVIVKSDFLGSPLGMGGEGNESRSQSKGERPYSLQRTHIKWTETWTLSELSATG